MPAASDDPAGAFLAATAGDPDKYPERYRQRTADDIRRGEAARSGLPTEEPFRGILAGVTTVPHVGPVLNASPPAGCWLCDLCERWMPPTPAWVTGPFFVYCPECYGAED